VERDAELARLQSEIERLQTTLDAVLTSRSWRLTAPLRLWAAARRESAVERLVQRHRERRTSSRFHLLTDAEVPALSVIPAAHVCAIVHVYYQDLVQELVAALAKCAQLDHVIVTHTHNVDPTAVADACAAAFGEGVTVRIREVANRGRDVLPLLLVLDDVLGTGADVFIKVHTKKSPHLGLQGAKWRTDLLDGLLGSTAAINRIVGVIASTPQIAFAAPANAVAGNESWGRNRRRVRMLARRGGWKVPAHLVFPAGNMFWCGRSWLEALRGLGIDAHEFEEEARQLDGTLAHAVERLIGCFADSTAATVWITGSGALGQQS